MENPLNLSQKSNKELQLIIVKMQQRYEALTQQFSNENCKLIAERDELKLLYDKLLEQLKLARLKQALTAGENFDEKSDWITITRYVDSQSFRTLVEGLDKTVQEKVLLSKTRDGSTFAHDFIQYKYKDDYILDHLWREFDFKFQQRLVQLVDSNGSSVAHFIARFFEEDVFFPIWDFLGADAVENIIILKDNAILSEENVVLMKTSNNPQYIHKIVEEKDEMNFKFTQIEMRCRNIKNSRDNIRSELTETQNELAKVTQENEQLLIKSKEERNISENLSLSLNQNRLENRQLILKNESYKKQLIETKNENISLKNELKETKNEINDLREDLKHGMKNSYKQQLKIVQYDRNQIFEDLRIALMENKKLKEKNNTHNNSYHMDSTNSVVTPSPSHSSYTKHRFDFDDPRFRTSGTDRIQQGLYNQGNHY